MNRVYFLLLTCLTAACSTPMPPAPPAPPPAPAPQAVAMPADPVVQAPAQPVSTESPRDAFDKVRTAIKGDSVYFDFDRYAIKSDQRSPIREHANLATAFPNDYVTLQGNCDERGGHEYNLALGQRRADSVKRALVLLGVAEDRIETISFGKEKPRASCQKEDCWVQNRRADFVDNWIDQAGDVHE